MVCVHIMCHVVERLSFSNLCVSSLCTSESSYTSVIDKPLLERDAGTVIDLCWECVKGLHIYKLTKRDEHLRVQM